MGSTDSNLKRTCRLASVCRRKSKGCKDKRTARSEKSQRRYQRTQQFSVVALTDSAGTIKERYAYSAYGQLTITDASGTVRTLTAEGNRYTYTAREWDEVAELYHYRARMYDPLSGRFCSRDPIGYEGSQWNLFEYTGGSPLHRLDAFGESWVAGGNPYQPLPGGQPIPNGPVQPINLPTWARCTIGGVAAVIQFCILYHAGLAAELSNCKTAQCRLNVLKGRNKFFLGLCTSPAFVVIVHAR